MSVIKPPAGFWLVHASKARTYHTMPAKCADVEPMCGAKLSPRQLVHGWEVSPAVSDYRTTLRLCPKCEALATERHTSEEVQNDAE